MRDIPTEVIANFPLPNYKNPKTRGPALLYTNGILIGITIVFVLLRVYTRFFIKRWMGADDWLILVATIFTIGLTTCVVLANERYYWDRHIYDVPIDKIATLGQIAMAAKVFFVFATFFTRVSLLSFYYRLLHDTTMKTYRMVLHAVGIFNGMVFIAFVILAIFECSPIASYWIFPATGKCINEGKLTLGVGVVNCFLDLLITALPIPMVMMLKMRLRQRIGVVVLLSLGFVVTIAGIVRTYFIWKSLVQSYDETWYAFPLWIAAAVEVDLAVICASAPAIRPFLLKYFRPLVTSLSGSFGSRFHKKSNGYVSTSSGPSGQNFSHAEQATFDQKISAGDTVRDDGKAPIVRLSLTKTPHEGKLKIMQRVSWEVDYEDQSKLRHPGDLCLDENEYNIGVAMSSSNEEEMHLREGRGKKSHSVDISQAMRDYDSNLPPKLQPKEPNRPSRSQSIDPIPPPRLQSMEPNAPFTWIETDPSQSSSSHIPQSATPRDNGDTFWESDDSESNYGSPKPNHPHSTPAETQHAERRWDNRRCTFRDGQLVVPTSPATSRTYEGARGEIEMSSFAARSTSLPVKVR